jgi:pimeloyl-ACP methyl ester carboxylesterase
MFMSHDGCRLQITRWGESGPVCIFLHGSGEGRFVWDDFAPTLAPHYQSLTVDLRGHGDSDWDASRTYRIESYVRDIVGLLDELGNDFTVVGHSLGGRVAAHVVAKLRTSKRARALVLVDAGPDLQPEAAARIRSDFKEAHRIYATVDDYFDWLEPRRALIPTENLRRFAHRSLRPRHDGTFELKSDPTIVDQHDQEDGDAALWTALSQITCPTLVLRGIGSSVLTHDVAQRIARTLPRGHLHTISGAGHALVMENAEGFAKVTRSFLERVGAEAKGLLKP